MIGNNSKSNNRASLFVFFLLFLLGVLGASTWQALSISQRHTPIVNISKDVKYETAVFHLWLEEYIAGDKTRDKAKVWEHIIRSEMLLGVMLNGGEYKGKQIHLSLNENLQKNIASLLEEITILDRFAQSRLDTLQESQAGSKPDIDFDEQFDLIQTKLLLIDDAISALIERNIERFLLLNVSAGLLTLLFGIASGMSFLTKERERDVFLEYKEKRADEIVLANKELAFQNEEKDKRAEELALAKKELDITHFDIDRIAKDMTQLVDTANAPIFGIDAQGKVNEWNQQSEKITGYSKAEVMGRDLVADFITDDFKVSVGEVLDNALKGKETENYEFPLFSKSGGRVDVLLNSTTRRDAFGKVVGVVGVGQDITELKSTQEQVIQTSKLATLGEMATSVAHELNQPLNVIRMAAGNSRRKIANGTADPGYLNDKLERIEEQTTRAAIIIDHMRMFGRNATEHPVSIDPRHVVTNALDLIGEQLRLTGIEIVTKFPKKCTSVLGHTIQLEQVILNLLSNAKDAMAESGDETKILLRVFEDGEGVHITSEDTGGGIPEDVLPRIFEPFYTTKEMGKGTGLGLSVSYGIVIDMGGSIVAENTDNGARFTITLPSVS
ncbi:MAG: PAS domain S-box-containing protein [Candidatus Azotimanducaceae bacterium]|jgi:PAS domain S-box-containing protein